MNDAILLVDQIVQNRGPEYMITANLNYLMLVEEHPELMSVNQRCCCILADGNPIVWRSRCESNPLPCRVAGSDMIIELARLSADKGYRIFFLGGAPGVAKAAAEQLRQRFPQMQVAGTYSPPFRQLSPDEQRQMVQRIRDANTDILLVAFGQPKGEFWIHENLEQLGVPLSIQLGASFDFLAGTAKRAPLLWQRLGCEWLYRALSDPQRLFPRYGKNILFLLSHLLADARNLAVGYWKGTLQPGLLELLRRNR
jgi:N-acetylglucosaminyldiphosphoundecaprenol N-acetyl-beta-D-mannosaminyltransferase